MGPTEGTPMDVHSYRQRDRKWRQTAEVRWEELRHLGRSHSLTGCGGTTLPASCKECEKGEGGRREDVEDVPAGGQRGWELPGFIVYFDRRAYRVGWWVGCQM